MALYLDDILRMRDITGKIRVVRHQDKRYDLERLYTTGEFEIYQATQFLPEGYVRPFPGYQEAILSYAELVDIIGHPDTNREWRDKLSAVAGVYLIVDTCTGMQYVGSASGRQGLWGRWAEYVKTGHGGNQRLSALLATAPNYVQNFQFSILHTVSRSMAPAEVIRLEGVYKKKLGSCAFGLNTI